MTTKTDAQHAQHGFKKVDLATPSGQTSERNPTMKIIFEKHYGKAQNRVEDTSRPIG